MIEIHKLVKEIHKIKCKTKKKFKTQRKRKKQQQNEQNEHTKCNECEMAGDIIIMRYSNKYQQANIITTTINKLINSNATNNNEHITNSPST